MTTIRSSSGIAREMAPSRTVLPVPVPPEMSMFFRSRTQISRNSLAASERLPKRDQVVQRQGLAGELADRQVGARPGAGRNDRVDAGAVGQPGVEHRMLLGDLPAHPLGDVVDRRQQGVVAGEPGVGVLQLAAAARCRCRRSR